MFDIGFWELALLGVIGLIVLGPERLPAVARTAGLWAGRAKLYLRSLRNELERETGAAELRRDLERTRDEIDGADRHPPDDAGSSGTDDSDRQ